MYMFGKDILQELLDMSEINLNKVKLELSL